MIGIANDLEPVFEAARLVDVDVGPHDIGVDLPHEGDLQVGVRIPRFEAVREFEPARRLVQRRRGRLVRVGSTELRHEAPDRLRQSSGPAAESPATRMKDAMRSAEPCRPFATRLSSEALRIGPMATVQRGAVQSDQVAILGGELDHHRALQPAPKVRLEDRQTRRP